MGEDKKSKVETENVLQDVDPNLVLAMDLLQKAQVELDKAKDAGRHCKLCLGYKHSKLFTEETNEEANDKVLEIEQIYMEKRRPIYQKRNEAIEKIPEFWVTAFTSHPALAELLTEDDVKAFKFLKSLNVEDMGDIKAGYKITFEFAPNPYFEDSKLSKVFKYVDESSVSDSVNAPRWKDGMDLTKPKKSDKKGKKRPLTSDSFFNWFSEHGESLIGLMPDEVAEIIKDDLWVNPLKYFNNDFSDSEEDDCEDASDDIRQGDVDDEDEDEDDEDD